jgi:hypothetical protein
MTIQPIQQDFCEFRKGALSINKSSPKEERLIILHEPLCERMGDIPVADLDRNGDTPHPGVREDDRVTCEMKWLVNSIAPG